MFSTVDSSVDTLLAHLDSVLDELNTLPLTGHSDEQVLDLLSGQRGDGSAWGSFDLTALCAEALLAVLDATAAPKPENDGVKDPRTVGQRNHDGLHDALMLILRSGGLPSGNGVAATMVFTMTDQQTQTGEGLATSGHGALIPACDALSTLGDARAMTVRFDGMKRVEAYSATHRIFTETQRLAMAARDGGCSFPGCTTTPPWCQAHHVTDFALTRRTTVADGTLLCGQHHRDHARLGWTGIMINGLPHWIPPAWLDPPPPATPSSAGGPPSQTPRRNHAHHPLQHE